MQATFTYDDFIKFAPMYPHRTAYAAKDPRFNSDIVVREWESRKSMLSALVRYERDRRMMKEGEWKPRWILYAK